MAKKYITDNTETQISGPCKKCLITVNATLAGTIKVCDATTGSTANVATVTNPTVGTQFVYYDFVTGVRIVASGACDITVNTTDSTR